MSPVYILIIHKKLKKFEDLQIGWAFYVFTGSTILNVIGFFCSFLNYNQDKRVDIPIVNIDEKEMRHHVKSINLAKS